MLFYYATKIRELVHPSNSKITEDGNNPNLEEKSVALFNNGPKYWALTFVGYIPSTYSLIRNQSLPEIDISSYKEKFNTIFRPSWGLAVVGYVPVLGNFANLASALHAYANGDPWFGHQKLAETFVGTYLDIMSGGMMTSVSEFAIVISTRMGAFYGLHQFMNPYVHSKQN
ncbi:uncharacterized protein LOC123015404 isoform X2 [Tribolium madens]|uniref:uncharacterized protein LOC123015404 isoform X2 n=1 Tax=Tribolium madens TaxID=41895 RepID=UPI001CF72FA3|nr:uncharacterized protein LOC123015404 isoform X2 [Tribolium madens]